MGHTSRPEDARRAINFILDRSSRIIETSCHDVLLIPTTFAPSRETLHDV